MMSPTKGKVVWASDGHKIRPAVIIAVLPDDTFLVSFGHDNPHPPVCVKVEPFTVPGKAAGLRKRTHFRGGMVIRREDIDRVAAQWPAAIVLQLQRLFKDEYEALCAAAQPTISAITPLSVPIDSSATHAGVGSADMPENVPLAAAPHDATGTAGDT